MDILIVEDNANKLRQIKEFFNECYPDYSITESHSFRDGLLKVYQNKSKLIILDMTLPVYEITHTESNENMKAVAGKEIMKRMINQKIMIPVIIITQFEKFDDGKVTLESLNNEFAQQYSDIWKGTVFYENEDWRVLLKELIDSLDIL